ncbi:MAG: hypothetical protein ACXITV_02565 [Luteibaculaceae bacterium]
MRVTTFSVKQLLADVIQENFITAANPDKQIRMRNCLSGFFYAGKSTHTKSTILTVEPNATYAMIKLAQKLWQLPAH